MSVVSGVILKTMPYLRWFCALGFILIILPSCLSISDKKSSKLGTIVLLNGTSSAGKTSIIRALKKIHGDSFEYVVGDEWLEAYEPEHPVSKSAPRNIQQRQVLSALFSYVKKISESGKNIFVDIVEFDVHYEHYCSILDCDSTVKILVYCPLDIVAEHVEKRNELGQSTEKRPLNLSFGQFQDIYKLQESDTEMVVERIKTSRMKNALQIAEKEVRKLMREAGVDEKDFEKNINLFSAPFRKQFKLDSQAEIVLVPQHKWDLIVRCMHTPGEIAETITAYLSEHFLC